MHPSLMVVALYAALAGHAHGQSNSVSGLDGFLYDITTPTVWGRQGSAHPNGEVGFSAANFMCNSGTVTIPWQAAMAENHPMFGFMITRLADDRMVQISDRSFCKHAFTSINGSQGPCLPCQNPGNGSVMGIGCFDVYGASNNGHRFWLGPADEIDPWLGTWEHVGSYFDQGDPDVGPPQNSDGIRSLTSSMTSTLSMGVVKHRVTVQEQELVVPNSSFYYMIHLIHRGEQVSKRSNNLLSRGIDFNWNGVAWTEANNGPAVGGTVLNRWPGSTLNLGGNGNDDGRIAVAVKVSGPTDGKWHYEYAVHNIDNARGAASFRIPVCGQANVENIGFRDIDDNSLNQWTATVAAGEIVWSAPNDNALRWNMLFNFWFDSDAAPTGGASTFDQALVGPGAASLSVMTSVPGNLPNVDLGPGCGAPSRLLGNGIPSIPNAGYSMTFAAAPATSAFVFYSFGPGNSIVGPGCTQYLDGTTLGTFGFAFTDASGRADLPLPIPSGLTPFTLYLQAAILQSGGPVLGSFGVTNGLAIRIGLSGCP